MEQLTIEQASAYYDSKKWRNLTQLEISVLQINQDRVCVPWLYFKGCLEATLNEEISDAMLITMLPQVKERLAVLTLQYNASLLYRS
jgi:hypothetical protein